jgi:hypothetical protein
VGAAVLVALVLAGCDGSSENTSSRDAQVYVATIRDVLSEQPAPEQPDALPVVFVVGVGEKKIPASVQAEVRRDLDDDAVIRFADQRDEALLKDQDNMPVREDGVLVVLGEVPAEGDPVHLPVEIYRSADDWSKLVLTIGRGSSQWTVTSESKAPAGDS